MGQSRLPDGVPSDNRSKTFAAEVPSRDESFEVPDTATPDFAIPATNAALAASRDHEPSGALARFPDPAPSFAKVIIETGEDDEDEDEEEEERNGLIHGPHAPAPMLILIALGLVLIALAAFAMSRREPPSLPNCAAQPEWNQYNCRTN